MKKILLLGAFALAACEMQEPPPPSPAITQLNIACRNGDLEACRTVANLEAQERQMRMQNRPVFTPVYNQMPPPLPTNNQPRAPFCAPNAYGQMICY